VYDAYSFDISVLGLPFRSCVFYISLILPLNLAVCCGRDFLVHGLSPAVLFVQGKPGESYDTENKSLEYGQQRSFNYVPGSEVRIIIIFCLFLLVMLPSLNKTTCLLDVFLF
jgi:hypothetical protein